jgi:hypothetical protein
MNILKNKYCKYTKYLYHYIVSVYGLFYYFFKRSSSKRIYQSMVYMHSISNGRSTLFLNRIVNSIEYFTHNMSEVSQVSASSILNEPIYINKDLVKNILTGGYAFDENKLHSSLVRKIINNEKLFTGKLLLLDNSYIENQTLAESRQSNNPVRLNYYSDSILENSPEIQLIAKSSYFLKIAESFLGVPPYLDSVTAWRSFPLSKYLSPSSKGAQLYHYDLDRLSWLKIFIYLTDVDENSGPHWYVEGSHIAENKRSQILKRGYVRIEDSELESIYGKDRMKKALGSAGTILYGNTLAFHKGEAPRNSERLILELQYTANNYGTQPIRIKNRVLFGKIFRSDSDSINSRAFDLL